PDERRLAARAGVDEIDEGDVVAEALDLDGHLRAIHADRGAVDDEPCAIGGVLPGQRHAQPLGARALAADDADLRPDGVDDRARRPSRAEHDGWPGKVLA